MINQDNEKDDLQFIESDEEGNPVSKKDTDKKIRTELKLCKKERDEYLTGWQRSKADYINLQKEISESKLIASDSAKEKFLLEILQVLDSFDMAFSNKESWEKVDENWRKGIQYIYQQFNQSLDNLGISHINTVDIDFDPNLHEPIDTVSTENIELEHKVAHIIQSGYKMKNWQNKEKVIRPAKVKVYKFEK